MAGVKKSRPKKSATNQAVGPREGVKRDEAAKKSVRAKKSETASRLRHAVAK